MTPGLMKPARWVARWQRASLSERSAAPQHFQDLGDLPGHPKPADVDPDGAWPAPWGRGSRYGGPSAASGSGEGDEVPRPGRGHTGSGGDGPYSWRSSRDKDDVVSVGPGLLRPGNRHGQTGPGRAARSPEGSAVDFGRQVQDPGR